eukprot:m.288120 g.288120  ORF g.288120 m.288120 type:complete len:100 (-) comp11904_c0_seq2:1526-1825(-)
MATDDDPRKNFTFPLVVNCDMNEEIRQECVETAVTAVEKHSKSNELAAKMVKEVLDKKLGPAWHVVIGEGFSFDIENQAKNLLFMFCAGQLGVLIWKSA